MKYIDADKLKAEIERRIKELTYDKYISAGSKTTRIAELHCIDRCIDSLQQEQPEVDLEKEIDNTVSECTNGYNFDWDRFARHFYELGLNARKK